LGEEDSIGPSFVQQLEEGYRNPVSSLREMIGEKKSQPAAFPNSVRLNFGTRKTPRNLLDFGRVPQNFKAKLLTAPIFHTRFPISGKTIPRNQDATSTMGKKAQPKPSSSSCTGTRNHASICACLNRSMRRSLSSNNANGASSEPMSTA
jgi:hypothetical protein